MGAHNKKVQPKISRCTVHHDPFNNNTTSTKRFQTIANKKPARKIADGFKITRKSR